MKRLQGLENMRPITLRSRVTSLLLQWSVLFVVAVGLVAVLLYVQVSRGRVEEQVLLAQSSARYLDSALSGHFQSLQRITQAQSVDDELLARLRAFRFQSFFHQAIYVVDTEGRVVLSDPPIEQPAPARFLRGRETITPLFRADEESAARLAIVQPFHADGAQYFVVAEMEPGESPINLALSDLFPEGQAHAFVIDQNGLVIADSSGKGLGRRYLDAEEAKARVDARESLVVEVDRCSVCEREGSSGRHIAAVVPLRIAPWGMVIERPPRLLFGDARGAWYTLIGTLVALVGVGWVLSRALSRSVVRPLSELSDQAKRMQEGDLSREIVVEGDEEIQVLATALDEARVKLAATLGELGALNEELEAKVQERTRESRRLVRRLLNAGEEERRRIARELHDEISQLLTVVQISIEGLDVPGDGTEKARSVLTRAQQEIHRIIFDLRPSLLDDLGLAAAIRWYAKNYLTKSDIQVSLEIEAGLRLPPEVEISVFRIYQEIVTNILRHSQADHVAIELYATPDTLVLMVEDNGVGFDTAAKTRGAGLVGLRERADLVGGRLSIDSEPEAGTSVTLEVPLES